MECSKKSVFDVQGKHAAHKFLKLIKVVKPMLKFMAGKHKTNAVTPSTCNYDVVESAQNDINESEMFNFHFKFLEANEEACDNSKNEELEKRLLENVREHNDQGFGVQTIVDDRITVRPVTQGTYFAVPVHFVETHPGKFTWALLTDVDICRSEDEIITHRQTAERQTEVCVV